MTVSSAGCGAQALRVLPADHDLATELRASVTAVAHTWMAGHKPEALAWSWGEGLLCFGLERAFQATHDVAVRDYLRRDLGAHLRRGIVVASSDDAAPGLCAIERVLQGDARFAPLATQVVAYSMHAPRGASGMVWHLGRAYPWFVRQTLPAVWIDSIFHLVPTLLRYSVFTGDRQYRDAGVRQLVLFVNALMDPSSGLVTHAYDDAPLWEPVPAFAHRAFWARGNGWMLATLVDALAYLPQDHLARPQLERAARKLEAALRATQAQSGLFHTLLLRPSSYEETAGSALILYAMARGLRLGIFSLPTRAAMVRGAQGLLRVLRDAPRAPKVTGTSLGTNPIELLYRITPTADDVSYGVGAWLLAAVEIGDYLAAQPQAAR
ncbi:MAG TPA: glycoside hydrolase family 88 protein [Polyangiales bacterium]